MVTSDVAQVRVAAANNAEPLQAMHPPEAVAVTIPPRSVAPSADAPASSAPAAPAPTSVAASQGGAAGGSTACSADCFEAQRVAANKHYALEQRAAKLLQQLRDKKTEVKLLQRMVHSSSAAGGAGAAAPTALSSASSSAPGSAAQQRIAELETQLHAAHHLVESVKQDWMLRAGFFPPGDPVAEAKKKKLKLNMLKDTSCTAKAIAKAEKAVRIKQAELAAEEDSLRLAAGRAAILRLEYEYAQMNLERKHKLAADATENDANNVDEQMRLLQEAEERKQRKAATKANTQRLRVDDAQLQQRLAVDQYEGVRAMFGTQANNLLMPSASSSMPASPAGAGAGVAQPTPPSASRQQPNPYFEDEAEEASEDEAEDASETDSEDDDADDKPLPD
jgi:hypothetical protein